MAGDAGGADEKPSSQRARPAAPRLDEIAQSFPQLEIIELLGQGGMGTVYKARQPQLDRFVALKILSADLSRDAAFAERFTREARALARLNHPNIVAVYDFGKAGDFFYFIMEFVDGENLWQLEKSGKLSPEEALAMIPKICEALQFAHDEGVVHRDIKPGNILVGSRGRVKIADFGLARLVGHDAMDLRLTGSQDVMGTLHYMAPEQVEHPLAVDHRADIYSLGVVFYEMLTGGLPIGRFSPPSKIVRVDVRVDEVVLRALENEPQRRYQHASEIKTEIETIARGPATKGSAPAGSSEANSGFMNRRWALVGVAAGVVAAVALLVVHHRQSEFTGPPPNQAAPSSVMLARCGFEVAEGYAAGRSLIGQQGWRRGNWPGQLTSDGQGVGTGLLPGSPQQAFIGGSPGATTPAVHAALSRILAFPLGLSSTAAIELRWKQRITNSTNGARNYFAWLFYDQQGQFVGGLLFDNSSLKVMRRHADNSVTDTGLTFERSRVYDITVTFDFHLNVWAAAIGSNPLPPQPIRTTTPAPTLGSMAITWRSVAGQAPTPGGPVAGDNLLAFDDLVIVTSPSLSGTTTQ